MKLIVGLGNPGGQYKNTRHNIGFEAIDKMAYDHNIDINKSKFKAVYGEGRICGEKVFIVKPQTFMNLSGEAVRELMNFYKIPKEDLIVLCDDIALPLGDIRIRQKGSNGGQKGLGNIIYQLGSEDFLRIRIGVGDKPKGWDLADYVLSKFKNDEFDSMVEGVTKATDAVELILSGKINEAMNKFNRKAGKNESSL